MPLLTVTGGPTPPSGKTFNAASLTIRFDEPYADGNQLYPTLYKATLDTSVTGWKPEGAVNGTAFQVPGGADGYPKPPVAFITERQELADGSTVTSTWQQRIIESSSGAWAYGTPAENALYVSQSDLPASYLQPGDDADTLGSGAATNGQVLTADGSGAAAWEDAPTGSGSGDGNMPLEVETTASYTPVLADIGKLKEIEDATAATVTLPPNSGVAFSIGDWIAFSQGAAGTVSFAAGAGVTIRSAGSLTDLSGQWATATAYYLGSDVWLLSGNLA